MIARFVADLHRRQSSRLWLVLGLAALTALLEGVSAALLVPLFRQVGVGGNGLQAGGIEVILDHMLGWGGLTVSLGAVVTVFICAVAAQVGAFLLFQGFCARMQSDYVTGWIKRLFSEILHADWGFVAGKNRGEIINAVSSDITNRVGLAITGLVNIAGIGCFIIVYLGLAFLLTWKVTLLLLLMGAVIAYCMRPISRRGESTGRALQKADSDLTSAVTEFVSAFKTLKLSHTQALAQATVDIEADRRGMLYRRYLFDPGLARAIVEFLAPIILVATLISGTLLLNVDAATVLVLVGVFARLYPRISTFQQNWQSLRMLLPTVQAMLSLYEQAERRREPLREDGDTGQHLAAASPFSVSFSNVKAGYGDRAVLKQVSFEVGAGEMVAIVGGSGAGKSTIVDCLMRLLPTAGGDIHVNGIDLDEISLEWWRRTVAYVAQDNVLLRGTIRQNIVWGAGDMTDADVVRAAKAAFAHDFIEAMEHGYDSIVGESGGGLSGGQRQRIAIARAMARNAPLLILDEATSALDSDSETQIVAALNALRGKTTVILIAHRFSTIRSADKILVIRDGRVVQSGRWEDLALLKDGPFRMLLEQQMF